MKRDVVDFDVLYAAAPVDPDPVAVAAATEDLRAAVAAADAAQAARADAEAALVDAEGAVAVLEFKVADFEADQNKLPWQQAAAREELAKAKRAFTRAGQRFTRSEETLAAADETVRRGEATLQKAVETPAGEPVPVRLRFASLPVFVEDFVLPNWVHRLGEQHAGRWCRSWWEHAEAVTRLEAIWEAFEVMRQQPAPSFSTWLRDHFDSHMRMLTATEGAFYRCDADEHVHELKEIWATVPPPAGMFPVDKDAMVQPKRSSEDKEEAR